MTIVKPLLIDTGPRTMTGENTMYRADRQQLNIYHNYSSQPMATTPQHLIPEHQLNSDLGIYASSPVTLYDETPDKKQALLSPTSTDGQDSFVGTNDLGQTQNNDNPMFDLDFDIDIEKYLSGNDSGQSAFGEASTWALSDLGNSDSLMNELKVEDVMVNNDVSGPTLAQLNSNMFTDINTVIEKERTQPAWKTTQTSPISIRPTSTVHASKPFTLASPPVNFTTCTVTSNVHTLSQSPATGGAVSLNNVTPPMTSTFTGNITIFPQQQQQPVLQANNVTGFTYPVNTLQIPLIIKPEPSAILQPQNTNVNIEPPTQRSPIKTYSLPVENMVIKQEPELKPIPTPVQVPTPIATVAKKRAISPDNESSNSSLDRKWQEIAELIEEKPLTPQASPPKKIKVEEIDVAYTHQEEGDREQDMTQDMAGDTEEESDGEQDDDFSDLESVPSPASGGFMDELIGGGKKSRRYFWQYNTQSKGPKGKRLCKSIDDDDAYHLHDFEDPVFDPELNQVRDRPTQYKHSGKARRCDGNDVNPNPQRLFQLGRELKKLNRKINDMMPVSEMPAQQRNRTRKEKNKYASRACRLKKKAQHEANKLKLSGLEQEHGQLVNVIQILKAEMQRRLAQPDASHNESMAAIFDRLQKTITMNASKDTASYVNIQLADLARRAKAGQIKIGHYVDEDDD